MLGAVGEDDQVVHAALVEPQVWLCWVRAEDVFDAPFVQLWERVPDRVHVFVVRVPHERELVLAVGLLHELDAWRRFEVVVLPILRVRQELDSWQACFRATVNVHNLCLFGQLIANFCVKRSCIKCVRIPTCEWM